MTPETVEAVKTALTPLAEKIGIGAEYGWETLVQGQFAEGVATVLISSVVLVSAIILSLMSFRALKRTSVYEEARIGLVIALIALGVASTIAITTLYGGIIRVVAPEYSALKFIISLGAN